MTKQEIRSAMLTKRTKLSEKLVNSDSSKIIKKILKLSEFKKAKNILLYLPIKNEVDLSPLLLNIKNKRFILPRVEKNKLKLHVVDHISQTQKGNFNIFEPHTHLEKITAKELDLALIPGVAFTKNGHRIGYGKGFFDRLLKKTLFPKIGVAYNFQIVNNVLGESHDVLMDIIVTEKKIYRTTSQNFSNDRKNFKSATTRTKIKLKP